MDDLKTFDLFKYLLLDFYRWVSQMEVGLKVRVQVSGGNLDGSIDCVRAWMRTDHVTVVKVIRSTDNWASD